MTPAGIHAFPVPEPRLISYLDSLWLEPSSPVSDHEGPLHSGDGLHLPYLLYILFIYGKEGVVDVVLSNTAGIPIYGQIEDQIKAAILRGEVSEGDALPSIRALARDLRVSVITTTRAYAELVADGLVANVPGKGYFVLPRDAGLVREQVLREVETHFANGVAAARLADIDDDEIRSILELALTQREDT